MGDSTYREALDNLNEAQRQAVTQLDGPVLVIAGPGTGKTQLLAVRVAHILDRTDTLPENILCLTFTESGVSAMRERLTKLIGKVAYDVTISTYHAFGSDLIRHWPDYFLELSDMQPVDDLGIDAIFREIIADLPYTNPLKYADMYIGEIKTLVSDARRALLGPDDLRAVAKQNEADLSQANPIVSSALQGLTRMDKRAMPLFEQLYLGLQKLKPAHGSSSSKIPPLLQLVLATLGTAVEAATERGNQTPLTAWKNAWLERDTQNNFVLSGKRVQQKLLAVTDVYETYLLELKARGLYDYDDMILRAVETLQRHEDFRYSLQERYLYILLDEFQDTNRAQFKLVELLTSNPVLEGRPDVLAVGDDDQAIYAFQGADYSNMLEFQRTYRDVLVVPLTKNYRSQPEILHTARGIAEQIEERLHHHFPEIEKTLHAQAPRTADTTVERREARSDVEQFGWVTTHIKALRSDGVALSDIAVLAPQHKYLEPLVAFLQQENIPLHYEKRENILDDPIISELIRMSELVLALSSNDYKLADNLWPEVLSYRFWDLPTSLIWQLSWQAHDTKKSWTEVVLSTDKLRYVGLFFVRLAIIADQEPLELLLDYLIGTAALEVGEKDGVASFSSPFYEHYFGSPLQTAGLTAQHTELPTNQPDQSLGTFWQLLTNLTVLRAHLREYRPADNTGLRLHDLIEFVTAHRAANIKILNTSPYQNAADAVQLMTAFKAKGQEFEVVFILACNDDAWGTSARGQGNRLVLPPNLQFIRYGGASNDERLRLFYVALTRAKSHLYMVSYTNTYSGKTISRLRYLDEHADDAGQVRSPLLPDQRQRVLPARDGALPPQAAELVAYWQNRHQLGLSRRSLTSLLQSRLGAYQLSPTDMSDFTDLIHAGPEAFLLYNLLHFPRTPAPELQYGEAIHEALHWLHLHHKSNGSLPTNKLLHTRFQTILQSKPLSDQFREQFLKRGRPVLSTYLRLRGHTISADNECEYSFRNEGVFIGNAHMSGKIDKLIIDPKEKTITIVDYKTGKAYRRWQHDIKHHRYKQQLYLYKLLVEHSHTFAGYKVSGAYVEFVEPDEEGTICELHLALDQEEEQRIERLAEVIWQRIQSLTFPDTSKYKPDLSGVEALERALMD